MLNGIDDCLRNEDSWFWYVLFCDQHPMCPGLHCPDEPHGGWLHWPKWAKHRHLPAQAPPDSLSCKFQTLCLPRLQSNNAQTTRLLGKSKTFILLLITLNLLHRIFLGISMERACWTIQYLVGQVIRSSGTSTTPD